MKGLMIQGTASDVGKTIVQTLLARYFANKGYKLAPFKSQNMTNFLVETNENKFIARSQALQAEAAKQEAIAAMNPIVLKIVENQMAEVYLQGNATKIVSGRKYREDFYEKGLKVIDESLNYLDKNYDLILAEGAGSPVELNLKDRELVNMKIAKMADLPVILVADIDRGGVFASIIGTLALLTSEERKRVKGIIINKFQGDITLFTDGKEWIEDETGLPVLGILPFISHRIEKEDSLSEDKSHLKSQDYSVGKYDEILEKFKNHLDFNHIEKIMNDW
ncbi:MAG: cobyric acid synthase [Atopostipes sp.]|nr:cobyric acid synthase [Atopostipes sp.]